MGESMERWGNEYWGDFRAGPVERAPDVVNVATYTATVDVAIVKAKLTFNEALHPDTILKALLADNWGSFSLTSWPTAGCTEQNRFRLMALQKIAIFLDMAEYTQAHGKPSRANLATTWGVSRSFGDAFSLVLQRRKSAAL